jgi:hypothetical protein
MTAMLSASAVGRHRALDPSGRHEGPRQIQRPYSLRENRDTSFKSTVDINRVLAELIGVEDQVSFDAVREPIGQVNRYADDGHPMGRRLEAFG